MWKMPSIASSSASNARWSIQSSCPSLAHKKRSGQTVAGSFARKPQIRDRPPRPTVGGRGKQATADGLSLQSSRGANVPDASKSNEKSRPHSARGASKGGTRKGNATTFAFVENAVETALTKAKSLRRVIPGSLLCLLPAFSNRSELPRRR